ncbi:hypothetical protein C8Q75DRAFT_484323 [Abortiporus biennis]|nr:hypothetical protein C8Q75DRAFT_484323 [Abortiporus biennis]
MFTGHMYVTRPFCTTSRHVFHDFDFYSSYSHPSLSTNSCQMSPTATLTINWEIVEPRTEHDVLPNNDLGCPSLHSNVDSVFDPVERMYSDGIECDVYRGTFRSGGNEYDAVIKIHYDGASVEGEFEAKHFCLPQIQDVQDLLIPRLYGFFQGGTYKYGMRTSCQVLEYVSKRIPWPIEDHKLQDRAFQTLCELHKRGIRHGILYDHTFQHPADGRIVFTNLSLATDKHECPSAKHPAPRGKKYAVSRERYLCQELTDFLVINRIWIPSTLHFALPPPLHPNNSF